MQTGNLACANKLTEQGPWYTQLRSQGHQGSRKGLWIITDLSTCMARFAVTHECKQKKIDDEITYGSLDSAVDVYNGLDLTKKEKQL